MGRMVIDGTIYDRIVHGREVLVTPDGSRYPLNYSVPCWMCHTPVGADHAVNCEVEQCPRCLLRWVTCPCGKLNAPSANTNTNTSSKPESTDDDEGEDADDGNSPFFFVMDREHLNTLADQVADRILETMQGKAYAARQIEELARLRDEGHITVAEFKTKKAKLLDRM